MDGRKQYVNKQSVNQNKNPFERQNNEMSESQCRVCLQFIDCILKLDDKVKEKFIWEALNSLARVSVTLDDPFPQWICWLCFDKLNQAIEFQLEVEKTDKILHSHDIECCTVIKTEESIINEEIIQGEDPDEKYRIIEPISVIKTRSGRVIKQVQNISNGNESEEDSIKREIKSECPVFESPKTLKKKYKKHRKPKGHPCCMCQTVFTTEAELTSHVTSTHFEIIEINQNKKHTAKHKFECKICRKKFRLYRSIRQHIEDPNYTEPPRNHLEEYQKRKDKLYDRNHQKIVCSYCGKIIANKYLLVVHELRMHAEDFPFVCPHSGCGKRFAAQRIMNKHKKTHGEKNYVCNVCGKAFLMEKILIDHSYLHQEIKPYQCDFCSRTFTYKSILKRHIECHVQEKIFRCDQCPKMYKWEGDLKRHVQGVHMGDLPFKCKYCNKGYFAKSSKKYHEQRCELNKSIYKSLS